MPRLWIRRRSGRGGGPAGGAGGGRGAEVGLCAAGGAVAQRDAVKKLEALTGPHTQAQRDRAITNAGSKCEFIDHETGRRCGKGSDLPADHIVPRALGGTNDAPGAYAVNTTD